MKIYKKFVFDMKTGKEIESESFEYDGEVALCGGGGKASKPTYTPPPPEKAQTKQIDESQTTARENQRQKAQRVKGIRSSILTRQNEQNTGNTLLGQ